MVDPAQVATQRLRRIRDTARWWYVAAVVAVLCVLALHLGATYALLPDIGRDEQARLAALEGALAVALLGLAWWRIAGVTRERTRSAIVDGLVEAFSTPATIEDTSRTAVASLVGTQVATAAIVAVAREDSDGRERLVPAAASGYPAEAMPPDGTVDAVPREPRLARERSEADPWLALLPDTIGPHPWVARVPLLRGEEVLGSLVLASRSPGMLRDTRTLALVGALVAGALDHARLYQAAFERSAELEQQDARRREFLYAITHELRSPLKAIQAFADLLMADAALVGAHGHLLTSLARGVERLSTLVNELLDLGRVEQPEMRVSLAPVDVVAALHNAETILRPAFMAREQSWAVEVPDEPLMALADAKALDQVLMNILSNANRFTPAHGRLGIRAHPDDGHVRIEVCDSGPGIDPRDRARVFEPFYRVSRPGAAQVPGSGLGLAVAQRLMQLQGGRIWVEDGDGEGSRFCIELPSAATANGSASARALSATSALPATVAPSEEAAPER